MQGHGFDSMSDQQDFFSRVVCRVLGPNYSTNLIIALIVISKKPFSTLHNIEKPVSAVQKLDIKRCKIQMFFFIILKVNIGLPLIKFIN